MGLKTPRTGPFHRIGDRFATLYDEKHFLGRSALEESWMTQPPRNILKKDDSVIVEIAMPGFKKEEIFIEVKDDVLHISAQKKKTEKGEYYRKEVPHQIAPQLIHLRADVDQDKIKAKLINGMLHIEIPHNNHPSHRSKTIKVA